MHPPLTDLHVYIHLIGSPSRPLFLFKHIFHMCFLYLIRECALYAEKKKKKKIKVSISAQAFQRFV